MIISNHFYLKNKNYIYNGMQYAVKKLQISEVIIRIIKKKLLWLEHYGLKATLATVSKHGVFLEQFGVTRRCTVAMCYLCCRQWHTAHCCEQQSLPHEVKGEQESCVYRGGEALMVNRDITWNVMIILTRIHWSYSHSSVNGS